jgi:hypothetical protein
MDEILEHLTESLRRLSEAGLATDPQLVEVERTVASTPTNDEQELQTLGALSREIWDAHASTRRAMMAIHQLNRIREQPAGAKA